ncbi:MAG: hypothetical protein COU47_01265 [Candidatus Niyogibacteria bacterium CG10_big_fil_rev_8_21_14_0_10_46_36]|uniref:Uncharacterized protein n=1 Tax=Candidatus Niyogibacteria bacterium CG10_big_fil_rev_8_21_14_0_10_46_36 TaxID=1974726 RepID=A0A2H0TDT3_9BACT|nr:MAG: hypothetical protein COU47_01265 [Candidatus Niyogibacteria bacterium CG10_big_fil_rev_8_21_14_0_10_46_36]
MSSFLRNIFLIGILAVFSGYLAFQLKGFVFGSDLVVFSPENGEHMRTSHVILRGQASGMSFLSLDGRTIFTDDEGFFEEELILPYGLNIIRIIGEGRFGKIFEEERMVYITGE